MTTTYHLAEPARARVDAQVAAGAAPDAEAYLESLAERDRERAERLAAWNAAIDEGFASGSCGLSAEEILTGRGCGAVLLTCDA